MNRQFDYFIKNFQLYYNIKNIDINYGSELNATIKISKSVECEFWERKKDLDSNNIVWKKWKNMQIPFLFEKDSSKDIISYDNDKGTINYDIVASAFYFLSGWNEYVSSSKDEFGRVKYEDSIIKKLNISGLPVINYYFDILSSCIKKVYKKNVKKKLWGDRTYATTLTHDIDTCKNAWLEGSFSELKKKRLFSIPKLILRRIFIKDDWYNFDKIMEIEKKYNASSSFYFLPQKGKIGNWKNADYNITSNDIRKTIAELKENNFEVGVHGSFGTHSNSQLLKTDIDRINTDSIIGNRFHFLMYDPEKTVEVLENCNIKYDTSLSFAEQIGFRRGSSYPFYLWNFVKGEISSVLEIPLTVMDSSLSSSKYMGLSIDEATKKVFEIIDEVKKFNGVFTLLWHNTFFSDYKYTGWKDVYCEILKYSKNNNSLLSNNQNIYNQIIQR